MKTIASVVLDFRARAQRSGACNRNRFFPNYKHLSLLEPRCFKSDHEHEHENQPKESNHGAMAEKDKRRDLL